MKNSMQDLAILLEKKTTEEIVAVEEIASKELERLKESLRGQLKDVENTTLKDTKKVKLSIQSQLRELELMNSELKKWTIRPVFIGILLLAAFGLVLVLGLEVWISHQIKTVTILDAKINKQKEASFSMEQTLLKLQGEVKTQNNQKLRQLGTKGIELIVNNGELYLIFKNKAKNKPELYQSTEEYWVVKQDLR